MFIEFRSRAVEQGIPEDFIRIIHMRGVPLIFEHFRKTNLTQCKDLLL